jgi:polysaccharide pyruvyl transferase WcaK-like protein
VTPRPIRVAAYGYFGMGNLGNEASLAAFVDHVRTGYPHVALSCYASDPDRVRREHGIPATRLMTYRAEPGRRGLPVTVRKVAGRVWDPPRTFALMGHVDVLVVPGTGVLETRLVATPWGLPLWLFLAALSCRLRGRPVVLLNVGAERPTHPVTRWLYRSTVRLATHCTYRDDASRAAASAMGATGRPGEVHPDLAFLLPVPETGPQRSGHVVLGVMTYEGRPDDPRRGPATVGRYRDRMVELGTRLLDDGHSLTIVVGDLADRDLAEAIAAGVRAARPGLRAARVAVSDATDVDGVMRETAAAEVVLASRFHTVICAVKTATPTVSLGYADKNGHLLAEFGLGRFSQPLEEVDVDRVVAQLDEARCAYPAVAGHMKETLRRYEAELHDELESLLGELVGGRRSSLR